MRISYVAAGLLVAAGAASMVACARPAAAADTKHAFAVHGIGALACSDLAKADASNDGAVRSTLASWMLGYLSSMNRNDAGTYDATPVQQEDALVDMVFGICGKYPDSRVETVVHVVFNSLDKAKVTEESPEVQASVGKTSTVLRQSTLDALENFLVAQKLLKQSDDNGKFDAAVGAALAKFQTAQKLPVTGLPDATTVIRALVELKPA